MLNPWHVSRSVMTKPTNITHHMSHTSNQSMLIKPRWFSYVVVVLNVVGASTLDAWLCAMVHVRRPITSNELSNHEAHTQPQQTSYRLCVRCRLSCMCALASKGIHAQPLFAQREIIELCPTTRMCVTHMGRSVEVVWWLVINRKKALRAIGPSCDGSSSLIRILCPFVNCSRSARRKRRSTQLISCSASRG